MAIDKVKVIKVDTDAAQTSVKDLRNQLKELKDTMLQCEAGTEEYNQALQQAADIQHTLKEQTEELNASAMDFGQIAGNVVKATGGMVAGLQAAKATMNLLGIENETVLKSLQQMQNLMAISQAIPAIDNGVKAWKRLTLAIKAGTAGVHGFKKALISTGIGAAVVLVGLLAANWDKVVGAMKEWGILHEDIEKKLEEQKKRVEDLRDKLNEANKAYKDFVKEQKYNNLSSEAKKEYDELSDSIKGYELRLNELAAEQAVIAAEQKKGYREEWEARREEGQQIHELMRLAKERQGQILADKNLTQEAAKAQDELNKKRAEAEKELNKKREEEKKAVEDLRKKYGDLAKDIALFDATDYEKDLSKLAEAEKKSMDTIDGALAKGIINQEQYEKDKLAIAKYYGKLRADAAKEEEARKRTESIQSMETNYQLQQAQLQKQYDEHLISEKDFNDRKKELQLTYVQDYIDNIQFILDTEKDLTEEEILDLTNKINEARASIAAPPEEGETGMTMAQGITEAINAAALALGDFSDNPAWGNILRNLSTIAANWDGLHEQMKKGGQEAFTAYATVAAAGLGAIANMLNGLAAEQDATNKEGFESQKKLQIAGATMSMLAGITSAWASSMQLGPIAGPIMGAILSAMMLATGIAQIVKIKNQKFDSKGSSAGSSSPAGGAVNNVIAPVQYTQDVQGASIEGAIKDTKVYVTETDITNTQNRVSVTESEAKY